MPTIARNEKIATHTFGVPRARKIGFIRLGTPYIEIILPLPEGDDKENHPDKPE
jgi:hypothetical protein